MTGPPGTGMSGELPGGGIVRGDERSAPFFAAAGRDVLLIRRCPDCGHWAAPEAAGCPGCGGGSLDWAPADGHGTLVSWTGPGGSGQAAGGVPALVELAEGPWLHTWLAAEHLPGLGDTAEPRELRADAPVTVSFVHPAEGESYPVFRLAPDEPGHQHQGTAG